MSFVARQISTCPPTITVRAPSQRANRRCCLLAATLLALLGGFCPGAGLAADASDAGWAVGQPSVFEQPTSSDNPSLQIAINHLLLQSNKPLLTKPAPRTAGEEPTTGGEPQRSAPVKVSDASQRPWIPPTTSKAPRETLVLTDAHPAEDTDLDAPAPANTERATAGKAESSSQPDRAATGTQSADDEGDATDSTTSRSEENPAPTTDDGDASPQTDDAADSEAAPAEPVVAKPLPPLNRTMMNLRNKLRVVLRSYYRQPLLLNTRDNTPWEVMHAMLAYELRSRVRQGSPRGQPITSIGWLCYNRPCKGQQMLRLSPEGDVQALYGVGLEGHGGQFLSMLAQCDVSPDYPIIIDNQQFTIQDLIETEQKTCYANSELSFKLIGLAHYVDLDATWTNDKGEEWDFPRLVREELAQPINGVACGGTHRLIGLTMAVRACRRQGIPIEGEYAEAAQKVQEYQELAFRLQNRDGSLSTSWFRGRGDDSDVERNVRTTGHQLEWLAYSLSDEQLRDMRMVRAVYCLTNLLYSNYDDEWDSGAMSHAVHALALYDERVFQPYDQQQGVASSGGKSPAARR